MEKQFRVKYPLRVLDYVIELITLLSILSTFIILAIGWKNIPETVPIHFNAMGIADGFASKNTLIILPIINILIYLVLTFSSKVPQIINFPIKITEQNCMKINLYKIRMIRWIKLFTCLLMTNITLHQIELFPSQQYGIGNFSIFIFLACILICILYFAIKMKKVNENAG